MEQIWKGREKEYQKEYHKAHYQANKEWRLKQVYERKLLIRKFFSEYKSTLKCDLCGETHISCLDFHHNDSTEKEGNISHMVNQGLSVDRIQKEIDKCTVLCANCHRKLHYIS